MGCAALEKEILPFVAPRVAGPVKTAAGRVTTPVEEVRLREGRPVELVCAGAGLFVTPAGSLTPDPALALRPEHDDMARTFQLLAQGSVYAWEEELRNGYLTLRGGHRVGVCGRTVVENGKVRTVKQVASLNIRVAREIIGAATQLLPRITANGQVASTLLIAPPQAGKTTVLRDLVRQLSYGVPALKLPGAKVGVVDERSEIAGCVAGVPQRDVGPRTDVLDGCPKAEGLMMLIRAMSPQVVAVDEVGRPEDAAAVMEALHAGVAVLATAHGASLEDIARRPALRELIAAGAFARAAILSRSRGPGTVERVQVLEGGAIRAG